MTELPLPLVPQKWDGKTLIDKPGIYIMTEEQYHADPCVEPSLSRSCITTLITQSPYHAWRFHPRLGAAILDVEEEEKEAMTVGSCVDELLFGTGREIWVSPYKTNQSNDAKAAWAGAIGRGALPIKEKHYSKACDMVKAFRRRMVLKRFPFMGEEFPTGNFQLVVIWHENGVWNRARLDAVQKHIWDYKSTKADAAPRNWIRNQLFAMVLEHQAAYYPRGWKLVTGEHKEFLFAVQEQNDPFDSYPVHVDTGDLERANQQITYAQKVWRQCLDAGATSEAAEKWPGLAQGVVHAVSPPYIQTAWEEKLEAEKTAAEIRKRRGEELPPEKAFAAG